MSTLDQDDKIKEKVALVMRQTNYNEEKALEKLIAHDYNEIAVVKEYLGVPIKKAAAPVKSVNQEIYRQIRYKLNESLNTYNKNNPVDINKVIQNLSISEENEKLKNKDNK